MLLGIFEDYEAAHIPRSAPHRMLAAVRERALEKGGALRLWWIAPESADLRTWRGVLLGAPATAHEGGIYEFELALPVDFPFCPPTFRFVGARPYHPNVNPLSGRVHADILQRNVAWTSAIQHPDTLLTMLIGLLGSPEAVDAPCANHEAGALLRRSSAKFERRVRAAARAARESGEAVLALLRAAEAC